MQFMTKHFLKDTNIDIETPNVIPPGVGLLIPCSVPRGGFLLPSSRVPGGMVMDETDTCIITKETEVSNK